MIILQTTNRMVPAGQSILRPALGAAVRTSALQVAVRSLQHQPSSIRCISTILNNRTTSTITTKPAAKISTTAMIALGLSLAGAATAAYVYNDSKPVNVDIPIDKSEYTDEIKKKAQAIKTIILDPNSSIRNIQNALLGASSAVVCCLHEKAVRDALFARCQEDNEFHLQKEILGAVEVSASKMQISDDLHLVIARDMMNANIVELANKTKTMETVKYNCENGSTDPASQVNGKTKFIKLWFETLLGKQDEHFINELLKTPIFNDFFFSENFNELKALKESPYSLFTNLLAEWKKTDIIVKMVKSSIDGKTALPINFFSNIASKLRSEMSENDNYHCLAKQIHKAIVARTDLKVFAKKQKDYHLAVVLAAVRPAPTDSMDGWKKAFLKVANQYKMFYTLYDQVAWCVYLDLPFYRLYSGEGMSWTRLNFKQTRWTEFIQSLTSIEECKKALLVLYPMVDDSDSKSAAESINHIFKISSDKFGSHEAAEHLLKVIGETLKFMNLNRSVDAREDSPIPLEDPRSGEFMSLHGIGEVLALITNETTRKVMAEQVIKLCQQEAEPKDQVGMMIRFCTFFGVCYFDYANRKVSKSKVPELKSLLLNEILEKMHPAEIDTLVNKMVIMPYVASRVCVARIMHPEKAGYKKLDAAIAKYPNNKSIKKLIADLESIKDK